MDFLATLFSWLVFAAGVSAVLAAALWALGWSVIKVFKMLRVWHVICLAVSIRLHGENYADRQFWWAIKERASRSNYSAKTIADYAMSHATKEPT